MQNSTEIAYKKRKKRTNKTFYGKLWILTNLQNENESISYPDAYKMHIKGFKILSFLIINPYICNVTAEQ